MELSIMEHSFNSYGGSWIFRPLRAVFEMDEKCFGAALNEVELKISFASEHPFNKQGVNKSLGGLYNDFNTELNKLPKRSYFRKKQILSISLKADFAWAEQVNPKTKEDYKIRNETYFYDFNCRLLTQLIDEVKACKRKFKKADDLNFDGFVNWLESLADKIPNSKDEADKLIDIWQTKKSDAYESLSEWDKLGLEWEGFHPKARGLVSDPRLWDQAHDFAPNGNDCGADILSMVEDIKNNRAFLKDGGKNFYETTWRDWGFDPLTSDKPDDSIEYNEHREMIIGLAFSFIKVKGMCPGWLRDAAISETENYLTYLETNDLKWEHREECLDYQSSILKTFKDLSGKKS